MEYIPFLHASQIFNIAFEGDLAFSEVRAILDDLLQQNAFDLAIQDAKGYYRVKVEKTLFEVWVAEMDVYIHKV